MDELTVEAVALPGAAGAIVDTWFALLGGEPHWVAPLRFERRAFLDPRKNPWFATADAQFFLARRGGRAVGTISAQVDRGYQRTYPGAGFFGFFEFDGEDSARALLGAACAWLRGRGMDRALGPFHFNSNHECGLLVDSFDLDPMVMTTWNPAWYPAVYDAIGLLPARDLYGWRFEGVGAPPPRIRALYERFSARHPEVRVRPIDRADWPARGSSTTPPGPTTGASSASKPPSSTTSPPSSEASSTPGSASSSRSPVNPPASPSASPTSTRP
jgi:hypothetical protein